MKSSKADDAEARLERQYAAETRSLQAEAIGGLRALDAYTESKFTPTPTTQGAFLAARGFDFTTDNLYLFGPTGTGKSHLAAIASRKTFVAYNASLITVSQMEVSRMIRSCRDAEQESSTISRLGRASVLVIEDLGVAKDTEFMMATIYELLNYRYQNRPGGLIITSNLSLNELARKFNDDRIPSRLAQMCKVFNFAGEQDRRLPAKK